MPTTKWSPIDPGDTRDYRITWTDFLPDGVTITDSVIVAPDDLTVLAEDVSDTVVTFRVTGAVAGTKYEIDHTITASDGQIFNLTAELPSAERIIKA